jgi:hypothetical protein
MIIICQLPAMSNAWPVQRAAAAPDITRDQDDTVKMMMTRNDTSSHPAQKMRPIHECREHTLPVGEVNRQTENAKVQMPTQQLHGKHVQNTNKTQDNSDNLIPAARAIRLF